MRDPFMKPLAKSMAAALEPTALAALAKERGVSEEEAVFGLLYRSPVLFGALSDWDDVRPIVISVIAELKPFLPWTKIYALALRVVSLYDTQVISVLRVYSDVKRLAYLVNEFVETMLEVGDYARFVSDAYAVPADNRMLLRGAVIKRITNTEVQKIFLNDKSRFFRAELYCASGLSEAHRTFSERAV